MTKTALKPCLGLALLLLAPALRSKACVDTFFGGACAGNGTFTGDPALIGTPQGPLYGNYMGDAYGDVLGLTPPLDPLDAAARKYDYCRVITGIPASPVPGNALCDLTLIKEVQAYKPPASDGNALLAKKFFVARTVENVIRKPLDSTRFSKDQKLSWKVYSKETKDRKVFVVWDWPYPQPPVKKSYWEVTHTRYSYGRKEVSTQDVDTREEAYAKARFLLDRADEFAKIMGPASYRVSTKRPRPRIEETESSIRLSIYFERRVFFIWREVSRDTKSLHVSARLRERLVSAPPVPGGLGRPVGAPSPKDILRPAVPSPFRENGVPHGLEGCWVHVGMNVGRGGWAYSWTCDQERGAGSVRVPDEASGLDFPAPPNHPPVVLSTPTETVTAGMPYDYVLRALDPDGDPLSFGLSSAPEGMTMDASSGTVHWVPSDGQAGIHSVELRVSDGKGGQAVQSFSIDVVAPLFRDATLEAGLTLDQNNYGIGAAWGDPDGDARPDLIVTGLTGPVRFYRNEGGGRFREDAGPAGLDDPGVRTIAASWADYDNDGDQDLLVTRDFLPDRLYRNGGDGSFSDVGATAGVSDGGGQSFDGAWGDYDGDGKLDLLATAASSDGGPSLRLYRNMVGGGFQDVSSALSAPGGGTFTGATWVDYDGDGDLDAHVLRLDGPDLLFRNDGGGAFTEVSIPAGLDAAGPSRSAAWADEDNDGDLDLFLAQGYGGSSRLLRNRGDGTFTDATAVSGLGAWEASGAAWGDHDNDGDLDLAVTGGVASKNLILYENLGGGSYRPHPAPFAYAQSGMGAAWADYDGDGSLDLAVASWTEGNRLFHNPGNANHWLQVRLKGTAGPRDALGAVVTVSAGGVTQRREVGLGAAFASRQPFTLSFGLGGADHVDDLTVRWPSGATQTLKGLSVDRSVEITEPPPPVPGLILKHTFNGLEPFVREDGYHEIPMAPETGPQGLLRYWEPGLAYSDFGRAVPGAVSVSTAGRSGGALSFRYSGTVEGWCSQDEALYPVGPLMDAREGAVEFWYKPSFNQDDESTVITVLGGAKGRTDRPNDVSRELDRGGRSAVSLVWSGPMKAWVANFTAWNGSDTNADIEVEAKTPRDLIRFNAGEWMHFAVVWKAGGFPDRGGKTLLIFVNGTEAASGVKPFDPSSRPFNTYLVLGGSAGSRLVPGSSGKPYSGASGAIDDLKVWRYAKTDFSDRFQE